MAKCRSLIELNSTGSKVSSLSLRLFDWCGYLRRIDGWVVSRMVDR